MKQSVWTHCKFLCSETLIVATSLTSAPKPYVVFRGNFDQHVLFNLSYIPMWLGHELLFSFPELGNKNRKYTVAQLTPGFWHCQQLLEVPPVLSLKDKILPGKHLFGCWVWGCSCVTGYKNGIRASIFHGTGSTRHLVLPVHVLSHSVVFALGQASQQLVVGKCTSPVTVLQQQLSSELLVAPLVPAYGPASFPCFKFYLNNTFIQVTLKSKEKYCL